MIPSNGKYRNITVLHANDEVVCPEGKDKSFGIGINKETFVYVWHGLFLLTIVLIVT